MSLENNEKPNETRESNTQGERAAARNALAEINESGRNVINDSKKLREGGESTLLSSEEKHEKPSEKQELQKLAPEIRQIMKQHGIPPMVLDPLEKKIKETIDNTSREDLNKLGSKIQETLEKNLKFLGPEKQEKIFSEIKQTVEKVIEETQKIVEKLGEGKEQLSNPIEPINPSNKAQTDDRPGILELPEKEKAKYAKSEEVSEKSSPTKASEQMKEKEVNQGEHPADGHNEALKQAGLDPQGLEKMSESMQAYLKELLADPGKARELGEKAMEALKELGLDPQKVEQFVDDIVKTVKDNYSDPAKLVEKLQEKFVDAFQPGGALCTDLNALLERNGINPNSLSHEQQKSLFIAVEDSILAASSLCIAGACTCAGIALGAAGGAGVGSPLGPGGTGGGGLLGGFAGGAMGFFGGAGVASFEFYIGSTLIHDAADLIYGR